jgi:L-malate glycosyltransferase
MRILYFSRSYTVHDRNFLEKLASRHEVGYLRLDGGDSATEFRSLPEAVLPLNMAGGTTSTDPAELVRLMPEVERLISGFGPDILLAGPIQGPTLLAALSGFHPLAAMSWGSDVLLKAKSSSLMEWATTKALSATDLLVCDCQAVRKQASQYADFSGDRAVVFPWGVELDRFSPSGDANPIRTELGWEDKLVLLSTRSFEPVYAIDVLLKAFAIAREQAPELRLLLAGDGSLAGQVDRLVDALGLAGAVHRLGRVGHDRLPALFRVADVYVSCSFSDGSSVSLLEAMASGLPAVVSALESNAEWVDQGVNGWLAEPGNVAMFADGLVRAANLEPGEFKTMGKANRAVAESRADWHKNIGKLFMAYERLVPFSPENAVNTETAKHGALGMSRS